MNRDFKIARETRWAQQILADDSGEFVRVNVKTVDGSSVTYFVSCKNVFTTGVGQANAHQLNKKEPFDQNAGSQQ